MDNSIFSANDTQARRMKQELFRKFSNYIDQSVQAGTPTPTARVKRHLLKDRSRDEVTRGVANLVMQFKETAYQILLSNKEALNDYYRAKGVTGAGMAMSEYMVLGMISYVAFETAKAAIFDQESPYERLMKGDKDSLRKLAFDYLNKSAVVPLISDAVDQGTSPYFGNNITSYIAGPTLGGTLPDAFNIVKSSNKEKSVRRFVKSNILPSNWIPLKAAQRNLLQYDLIMNEKIRK
jgi:hypothetical protein